jgi:bacillithiol biosynthesis cysteine-adding enzyme BshC
MKAATIPFSRYPGLPPLFLDFLQGSSEHYPDPPTLEAAAARGREILGTRSRVPAEAFLSRVPAAREDARALETGRAVAVVAGHQVGLFTGPLFTLLKVFDAIRVARDLSRAGVAAVPVFFALTDDHDLEEIARTARPGENGPEILVLEGADRANRRPVGRLPIPERVREVVEAFRPDARGPGAVEILERFAARSAPGTSYGDAFRETLFDLVGEEPLLVLDPLAPAVQSAAGELFARAAEIRGEITRVLERVERRLTQEGRAAPVPERADVFPFFVIENGERRRVEDPAKASVKIRRGETSASADVLTRPVLKSWAMPVAATILGPSEIAYHAQALPLFELFGATRPVLLPRSHVALTGPRERRAAEALGTTPEAVLEGSLPPAPPPPPEAAEVTRLSERAQAELESLSAALSAFDPTLVGAVENTRKKVAYQLEQLRERIERSAEKRDEIARARRARLETMLRPGGSPPDRVYPPLVPLLAYGWGVLEAIREGATGSTEGVSVVEIGNAELEPAEARNG